MSFYKTNFEILKEVQPELCTALEKIKITEEILVGDALNGQKFLAKIENGKIMPLSSSYNPTHEAERFATQFSNDSHDINLLLFGLGNGMAVREILKESSKVRRCIVYEPSISIFRSVIESYDIRDILSNYKFILLVNGINEKRLELILDDTITYRTWNHFQMIALPKYREIYPDIYQRVKKVYNQVIINKSADMNSLIHFAQAGLKNEIKAMKWMIDCRTLDGMKGKVWKDLPCIVVAAGPSLEKNVEVLKQAKGKAFILCVDTAISYLLKHNIIPDMTCTVDPQKGASYFKEKGVSNIPIAVSTESDYHALEQIGNVKPVYISCSNAFYSRLFEEQGYRLEYFEGGGSVGTVCFKIALEMGFHNIIIIGQDLAFTDNKAHAGAGEIKDSDYIYNILEVEGYYGGKVSTRGDFKCYIDWYNMVIPEQTDRLIINATEGGAKLQGAVQMTLQEAVNRYCKQSCDVQNVIESIPETWQTHDEKYKFYQEVKKKYYTFTGLQRRINDGIGYAERAITLVKRGRYQQNELIKLEQLLGDITSEIDEREELMMFVKRMIEVDIEVADDLYDSSENLEQESIRLYEKMKKYLMNLDDVIKEAMPVWKQVLEEINNNYHFE